MQIYAAGHYYAPVAGELPDLKAPLQAAIGESVRRVGRFIQLALIGAGRCAQGLNVPPQTAVFFSSARGDLETTIEVMTAMFRDGLTPKPLSFVNTVSNAACFYVARHLKLQSRSNFICNRYFAFESVLQMAALDLSRERVESALVGSTDVVTTPLHEHRERLELAADAGVAEASHWLWLGAARADRPRLGELLAAKHFADRAALFAWLELQSLDESDCVFAAGQFLSADDAADIRARCGLSRAFEYRRERAYYDSQSGAVIEAFLRNDFAAKNLLHINSDPGGRYSVMWVRR